MHQCLLCSSHTPRLFCQLLPKDRAVIDRVVLELQKQREQQVQRLDGVVVHRDVQHTTDELGQGLEVQVLQRRSCQDPEVTPNMCYGDGVTASLLSSASPATSKGLQHLHTGRTLPSVLLIAELFLTISRYLGWFPDGSILCYSLLSS